MISVLHLFSIRLSQQYEHLPNQLGKSLPSDYLVFWRTIRLMKLSYFPLRSFTAAHVVVNDKSIHKGGESLSIYLCLALTNLCQIQILMRRKYHHEETFVRFVSLDHRIDGPDRLRWHTCYRTTCCRN